MQQDSTMPPSSLAGNKRKTFDEVMTSSNQAPSESDAFDGVIFAFSSASARSSFLNDRMAAMQQVKRPALSDNSHQTSVTATVPLKPPNDCSFQEAVEALIKLKHSTLTSALSVTAAPQNRHSTLVPLDHLLKTMSEHPLPSDVIKHAVLYRKTHTNRTLDTFQVNLHADMVTAQKLALKSNGVVLAKPMSGPGGRPQRPIDDNDRGVVKVPSMFGCRLFDLQSSRIPNSIKHVASIGLALSYIPESQRFYAGKPTGNDYFATVGCPFMGGLQCCLFSPTQLLNFYKALFVLNGGVGMKKEDYTARDVKNFLSKKFDVLGFLFTSYKSTHVDFTGDVFIMYWCVGLFNSRGYSAVTAPSDVRVCKGGQHSARPNIVDVSITLENIDEAPSWVRSSQVVTLSGSVDGAKAHYTVSAIFSDYDRYDDDGVLVLKHVAATA